MKENDYVNSPRYGIGKVTRIIDNGLVDVLFFKDNVTKTMNPAPMFIQKINDEVINKLKQTPPLAMFDSWTIAKSEEYVRKIDNVEFIDNIFTTTIKGTSYYKTKITFVSPQKIRVDCTCPVNGKCKHEAALYTYLYRQASTDKSNILKSEEKLDAKLCNNTTKFLSTFFNLESFWELQFSIKYMALSSFDTYIRYLFTLDYEEEVAFIMQMVIDFKNVNNTSILKAINKINNPRLYYIYSKWNQDVYMGRTASEVISKWFWAVSNEKYSEWIKFALEKRLNYDSPVIVKLLEFAMNKITLQERNDLFDVFTVHESFSKEAIKPIIEKYYDHEKNIIYLLTHGEKNKSYINELSPKTFFEIYENIYPKDTVIYYFENNSRRLLEFDKIKTVSCLLSLHKILPDKDGLKLHMLINNLDISKHVSSISRRLLYARYKSGSYIDLDTDLYENSVHIWDYFLGNYEITFENENVFITYYLFLQNGLILFEQRQTIYKDEIVDEDEIENYLLDDEYDEVIELIRQNKKEEFEKDLKNAKKATENYIIEKEQEKLRYHLERFVEDNRKYEIGTLKEDLKVDFQCEITLNESNFALSLKIGNKKMYVVKSMQTFLQNFNDNELVKYGKELSFYHNVNNLTKTATEIYTYMRREGYFSDQYYYQKNCIYFSYVSLPQLFDILKNKKIILDGAEYIVTLDKRSLKTTIDENYVIHVEGLNKDENVIFAGQNGYIINKNNKHIEEVDTSSIDVSFLRFSLSVNGTSLERQKEYFINNIYAKFQEQISVDEKIKEDFKLSLLEISSYFDYVNKKITVSSKYFKDNVAIIPAQITEYNDASLKNKYDELLSDLGFDEGVMENDDDIYHFFSMDFTEFKKISKVFLSESIMNKQMTLFTVPQLRVTYDNNMMKVFLEESYYSDEELYALLKAIRNKKKYYILNNDTIVDLNNNEAKEFYNLVTDLKLNEKKLNEEVEKPLYQSFKLLNYSKDVTFDNHILKMINDIANYKDAKFEIPQLNATYRKYQEEGFLWLKTLASYNLGGILADDMGLGKTLEIIMLLHSDTENKPSLIVCPKSLIFNWKSEFLKFDSSAKVVEIYGSGSYRQSIINKIKTDEKVVYITSYDSLRNDEENYRVTFEYLIIDEGQYIKNSQAQKSQIVKKIKSKHRFALTGTPVENNIYDLWSIFDFLMPNYLESIDKFKEKYNSDNEYTALVAKKVSPFILRRTKKEVLKDLPNKYERIVTAEMNQKQRMVYDAHCLQAKDILSSGGKSFDVLYLLTRLRQICVDPATFVENYNSGSGKIDTLLSLVDEYIENGHKILIFSQFVKALNIVSDKLDDKNIDYYRLTGDTSGEERIRLCNQFNNNDKVKVFLISLKAGGTGLNLVGADTIIHLDPWWNVAVENQASDRAYRIGQTRNVEVIKLICRDSIEQRVIELQNIKKDLFDKLISNDDSSITKLNKEDIDFILK